MHLWNKSSIYYECARKVRNFFLSKHLLRNRSKMQIVLNYYFQTIQKDHMKLHNAKNKLRKAKIYQDWGPKSKYFFYIISSLIWNDRHVLKVAFTKYWVGESRIFYSEVTLLRKLSMNLSLMRKWSGTHFVVAKWRLV